MAIIDSETWRQWMTSPVGRYALDWEQSQFDAAVADLFGENLSEEEIADVFGGEGQ